MYKYLLNANLFIIYLNKYLIQKHDFATVIKSRISQILNSNFLNKNSNILYDLFNHLNTIS